MQLFECPKIPGRLTLSAVSCANQHRAAQTKEWAYRLPHCVECSVGAGNAGLDVGATLAKKAICIRCGSVVGRMVLERYCMSCYNREREWRLGRNAKGNVPREYRPLERFALIAVATGRRYLIEATSVVEARLAVLKVWGPMELVFDHRDSKLASQLTIFEDCREIHAKTPSSSAKTHYIVDNRQASVIS